MKLMKSALLGTAAALATVAGAQAADLPSAKSAPVSYVRICDVYGAGFFYIPGTQTCLKVGGRVRFELQTQTVKSGMRSPSTGVNYVGQIVTPSPATSTLPFLSKNGMDSFGWNSRGYLSMDARTQSAWGTVQTVILLRVNSNSGTLANNYSVGGVLGNAAAQSATLENAYIRFAGFTFGRAYSFVTPVPPYMWNADQGGGFGAGIKQLAYTATFGGGFSATIGIEDRADSGASVTANALGINPLSPLMANATAVGPSRLPNLAANLRVDQAWGWAQLSGVVGQNTANFGNLPGATNGSNTLNVTNNNGPLVKRTGWMVNAATRINLPMIAAGDHLHLQASFANGLINYSAAEANGGVGKIGLWNAGLLRNDRNMTIFCANAACTVGGSEQTKAWSVLAMFTHYWTPTVRQNFSASYQVVTPGRNTRNTDWQQGGLSAARNTTLGTNVIWSPVAGFDIGLELTYTRLQQKLTGLNGALPTLPAGAGGAAACPTGVVQGCFKPSANVFGARMRVERTF